MTDERLIRAAKNWLPEKKDMLTPKQVEQKTGVSQRVQQKMAKKKILPEAMTLDKGRQTYYNGPFIEDELYAIGMFRTIFLCSLDDLAEIARNNKDKYFKDLFLELDSHLTHISENSKGKKQGGSLRWDLGTNKVLQLFAKGYIEKLKKGLLKKDCNDYMELVEYYTNDKG